MDSSSSCVKIRTLGTNPLLLVEIVEGERCSRSSYKCQLQKDRDRLGQLPDEILIWILCSLSVDEAARTSVLSRRWEKLWRKMILVTPRLEFYCMKKLKYVLRYPSKTSVSEAYEYMDLVDEVTKLHPLPTLEEFTVGFPFNSMNSDDIDRWVEFAAEKEVKKLKFDFGIKIHHTDQSYEGFLASQGTGRRLNQLRDLYLRGVNVDPKVMQCLFSTSPFLQRLCVIDSHRLFMLEVAAPNLNYLEIRNCDNLQLLNISAPNLNKLKLFLGDSLLGIDNAFLGDSLLGIDNMSAPDLSHLSLGLHYMSIDRLRCIVDCFQELLGRLSQLKKTLSLRLSCEVFCEIAKTMDIWHQFPELSNVEYLKISVIDPWPWWYVVEGLQLSHGLLWPCALVKAAPVLHKLSIKLIHKEHKFTIRDMDFKWMDEDIPKKVKAEANFRHSHRYLKVVELFGFIGCRNDVEFVLHLLEIAVSLEKITIRVCPPSILEDTDNLRDEENQFADKIQQCAQLLKKTRPYIDLLII